MTKRKHLYHLVRGDSNKPFYVGHTDNPIRRERDHRHDWKKGHEDKYILIRQLEKEDIDWSFEVIRDVPVEEYVCDWEDFEIIKCIRQGHTLTNMKKGDKDWVQRIATQAGDKKVRTVEHIRKEREIREQESLAKSEAARKRLLLTAEREEIKELFWEMSWWILSYTKPVEVVKAHSSTWIPENYEPELECLEWDFIHAITLHAYEDRILASFLFGKDDILKNTFVASVYSNCTSRPLELLAERVAEHFQSIEDFVSYLQANDFPGWLLGLAWERKGMGTTVEMSSLEPKDLLFHHKTLKTVEVRRATLATVRAAIKRLGKRRTNFKEVRSQ